MNKHLNNPKLTAYALGELSGRELTKVEKLLASDANARAAVEEISGAADAVRNAFAVELSAGASVAAVSQSGIVQPAAYRIFARGRMLRVIWRASAVAAGLGLVVGSYFATSRFDRSAAPAGSFHRHLVETLGIPVANADRVSKFDFKGQSKLSYGYQLPSERARAFVAPQSGDTASDMRGAVANAWKASYSATQRPPANAPPFGAALAPNQPYGQAGFIPPRDGVDASLARVGGARKFTVLLTDIPKNAPASDVWYRYTANDGTLNNFDIGPQVLAMTQSGQSKLRFRGGVTEKYEPSLGDIPAVESLFRREGKFVDLPSSIYHAGEDQDVGEITAPSFDFIAGGAATQPVVAAQLRLRDEIIFQRAQDRSLDLISRAKDASSGGHDEEARGLAQQALQEIEVAKPYADSTSFEKTKGEVISLQHDIESAVEAHSTSAAAAEQLDIAQRIAENRHQLEQLKARKIQELFDQAKSLRHEQRTDEAAEVLNQILYVEPSNVRAREALDVAEDYASSHKLSENHVEAARELRNEHKYAESAVLLRHGMQWDPSNDTLRTELAATVSAERQYRADESNELLGRAVQLRLEDKFDEAQAILGQAYTIFPDNPGIQREAEAIEAEVYAKSVDNQFKTSFNNPLSTFSIDVDTASYSNIRRYVTSGQVPPRDAVRVEEMLNYFSYDYAPPTDGRPVAAHVEIANCPWAPDHRLARIGLKARMVNVEQRPDCNLVFLVDVSGSMGSENRLGLVKQGLKEMVPNLRPTDRVGIVTYAGYAGVALEPTPAVNAATILAAIDSLGAGGSTNGSQGISTAYDLAAKNFIQGGINRVLLATDGDFNVGITSQEELTKLITEEAQRGVFLSVLGVGSGAMNDKTMETLADKGNGNYAYLDSIDEARKVLVEQANGTLMTVAKDVKVQVEFNPALVAAYRLIGYENRMLAAKDFNDDTKDAGEMGAGHTVTALYELIPAGADTGTIEQNEEIDPAFLPNQGPIILGGREFQRTDQGDVDPLKYQTPSELAKAAFGGDSVETLTVKIRYKQPDGDTSELMEVPAFDGDAHFADASDDFRFAAAVAGYGMILRESVYVCGWKLQDVLDTADAALGPDFTGYRSEFLNVVMDTMRIR